MTEAYDLFQYFKENENSFLPAATLSDLVHESNEFLRKLEINLSDSLPPKILQECPIFKSLLPIVPHLSD